MQLSDGEKLILVMLCDIHKALNLKGAVDLDALRPLILDDIKIPRSSGSNGHDGGARVTAEVGGILAMWSAIERSYKHLSIEEKRVVEAEAGPLGRGVRFSGFDAASEIEYRDAAHHLIEESGRFERFQGRNLDAHMPTLAGYRRMLRLYAPMRPAGSDARLSAREIIALANAEKYAG